MPLNLSSLFRRHRSGAPAAGANAAYLPAHLGIDGLPSDVSGLRIGGLYVIMLPPDIPATGLLADTLAPGLRSGSHLAILDSEPQSLAGPLRQRLADLQQDGLLERLSLFGYDPAMMADPTDHVWDFLSGLEGEGLHHTDALIFLSANDILAAHGTAALRRQLGIYREWLRHHGVAGLFLVRTEETLWALLQRHGSLLDGLARLVREDHLLTWRVQFWAGDGTQATADGSYPVGLRQDGALFSLGMHQAQASSGQPATDEHRVLTCWNPSTRGQSTPANWEVFDSVGSLMAEAARSARAATVLLDHHDPAGFEALAREVHTLRIACGRRLKIVVREAGASVDYTQEMQLYHLGASRIMREGTSLPDCFRAIAAIKGLWFWRPIEPDFDAFLASARTREGHGYLPPVDFATTTDEFMRCALSTDVDSVLVRLTLRSDRHHLAAVQAFRPDRPGAFITTDDKNLYLFLFACPASDVDGIMSKVFDEPVGMLFAYYEVVVVPAEIDQELERLRYNAEFVGYTDYSDMLQPAAAGH